MAADESSRNEAIVALLVDYENVADVPLKDIFRVAAVEGRVAIRRIYGNMALVQKAQDEIRDLAFEPVTVLRSNRSGKNAIDIYLAIDAVDLVHRDIIDTFVLATSDSDFARLARRIKESGKRVVGVGWKDRVGEALVQSCDLFVRLPLGAPDAIPKTPEAGEGVKRSIKDLVMLAFESAIDETGAANGGKLHATIRRLDPSFDYRSLGYKSFREFLETGSGLALEVDPDPPMMVHLRDDRRRMRRERDERRRGRFARDEQDEDEPPHDEEDAEAPPRGRAPPPPRRARHEEDEDEDAHPAEPRRRGPAGPRGGEKGGGRRRAEPHDD